MKRSLWGWLVPGSMLTVFFWVVFAAVDIMVAWRPAMGAVDLLLATLNLYSWDYQRRHTNQS